MSGILGRIWIAVGIAAAVGLEAHALPVESLLGAQEEKSAWKEGAITWYSAGDKEGQRVIFIHGTPGFAAEWSPLLHSPLPGMEFTAYDRPGFGATLPEKAFPTLSKQAQALKPLLVERNERWPILVAHSYGAPVACRAAAEFPEQVGGLVLIGAALDPELLEPPSPVKKVFRSKWFRRLMPSSLRNARMEAVSLKKQLKELAPMLGRIRCPVIVFHGTEDTFTPYANVAYIQKHLPPGVLKRVNTFEGRNHFLPWTEAAALLEAIQELHEVAPGPVHKKLAPPSRQR